MNDIAWREMLKKYCGRVISDEEMDLYVHGRPNADSIRHYINSELTDEEAEVYSEEKEVIYRALCLQETALFRLVKGLEPLLDRLKEHGIPFAIATAAGRNNVNFYFEHLGLSRWFSIDRVAFDDGTLPGKPAPDVYLRACKILNTEPGDCIVAEDSMAGLTSAERAGIGRIIAVASTLEAPQIKDLPMVYAVIEDFEKFEETAGLTID